jgi:hypothetical protein
MAAIPVDIASNMPNCGHNLTSDILFS